MGLKQFVTAIRTAFPDASHVIEDLTAEEDKVVLRWSGTGTQKGELFGAPATGKSMQVSGITILHIADNKVVEDWTHWNTLSVLQQLGLAP